MAQKREKLQEEVVKKLKEFQAKANDSLLGLGEVEIRLRELNAELEKINEIKKSFLSSYDESISSINAELKALEINFPKGEIDLNEGVVIYESAE